MTGRSRGHEGGHAVGVDAMLGVHHGQEHFTGILPYDYLDVLVQEVDLDKAIVEEHHDGVGDRSPVPFLHLDDPRLTLGDDGHVVVEVSAGVGEIFLHVL